MNETYTTTADACLAALRELDTHPDAPLEGTKVFSACAWLREAVAASAKEAAGTLSKWSLESLISELRYRNANLRDTCKACAENHLLKVELQKKDQDLKALELTLKSNERLLVQQREFAQSKADAEALTSGQRRVLDAAKAGNIYQSGNGTGRHFSSVPGFPCWDLTDPVAQVEWERRQTEGA